VRLKISPCAISLLASTLLLAPAVSAQQARERQLRRWSRSIGYWQQPAVIWINEPSDDATAQEELLLLETG
jgi:hypothetical protein